MTVNSYALAMELMGRDLWPILYATPTGITCIYIDTAEETGHPRLRELLLHEDDAERFNFMVHFIPALVHEGVVNREGG